MKHQKRRAAAQPIKTLKADSARNNCYQSSQELSYEERALVEMSDKKSEFNWAFRFSRFSADISSLRLHLNLLARGAVNEPTMMLS